MATTGGRQASAACPPGQGAEATWFRSRSHSAAPLALDCVPLHRDAVRFLTPTSGVAPLGTGLRVPMTGFQAASALVSVRSGCCDGHHRWGSQTAGTHPSQAGAGGRGQGPSNSTSGEGPPPSSPRALLLRAQRVGGMGAAHWVSGYGRWSHQGLRRHVLVTSQDSSSRHHHTGSGHASMGDTDLHPHHALRRANGESSVRIKNGS